MVFCNVNFFKVIVWDIWVTILILIDGFLQYCPEAIKGHCNVRHNPYFNRWFSAIKKTRDVRNERNDCHNPYFNRWFSAIIHHNKDY